MATGVGKGAGTVNIQQEGGGAKSGRGKGRFRGRGRGKGPHVGPLSGIGLWNGIGMSNSKVFIPSGSEMIPPTANNHHPPPTKMWTTTPAVGVSSSAATATVATNTAPVKAADNVATNLQNGGNKATRVRSNRSRTTSGTAKIGSW